jgi:hypothetical protein
VPADRVGEIAPIADALARDGIIESRDGALRLR